MSHTLHNEARLSLLMKSVADVQIVEGMEEHLPNYKTDQYQK